MSTSATMTSTSTLQGPLAAPPSGPLPALPVSKARSAPRPPDSSSSAAAVAAAAATPSKLPSRSFTATGLPAPRPTLSRSTPAVPTLNTISSSYYSSASASAARPPSSAAAAAASPASALPTPGKTLRKTSSIGAFPLPPRGAPRVSSLPPSPLSNADAAADPTAHTRSARSVNRPATTSETAAARRPKSGRSSGYGLRPRVSAGALSSHGSSPSLLNGSADNPSAVGARGSDSYLSLPSPPQSRSSSANGSYLADTPPTLEDAEFDPADRGRPKSSNDAMTATTAKRSSATKDGLKGNVIVSVRVRPDAGAGDPNGSDGEWMVDGRRALISCRGKDGGDYRYDNVYSPHDNNSRVYDTAAKRLVRRVMEGYHGTVFAYGMTGTGKTFSMQGTANSPGVIPLAITDIFSYIRENPAREFLLRVSYLEIYNERIYDLLSQTTPPGQNQQAPQQEEIKLREDSKRGVYATPLKEEIVQSPNQLLRVIARGDLARRTSSTQFNARSSRSHAVVQIVVESRERTPNHGAYFDKETRRQDRILPGGVLVSTLSLIDLAGSERAADDKERRTEGAHINKSLLTLGTVIARLSGDDDKEKDGNDGDGAKPAATDRDKDKSAKHLPYRDSKLTRLLQPALSGNSLVSILCTIQLSSAGTSAAKTSSHVGETLNTLKFASRAKNNIVSHARRNESNAAGADAGSRALLDRYRLEIQELRAQLESQTRAKDDAEQRDDLAQDRRREEELERQERVRHEEQMLEMQLARTALKERISHLNRLILSSKSLGVNSHASGRFSSASVPLHRMSSASNQADFGRPVSVRSRDSGLQSRSLSRRESAATLDVLSPPDPADADPKAKRTFSTGSITTGVLPAAQASRMIAEDDSAPDGDEDEEDNRPRHQAGGGGGEQVDDEDEEAFGGDGDGDGNASLAQQNRMLQADLADKNRYIATLEKRLIQARRTSHSRASMHYTNRGGPGGGGGGPLLEEGGPAALLADRDREIEELRAKLDDQMRMVTALRSAARKREMLERRRSQHSEETLRPATSNGTPQSASSAPGTPPRRMDSRASSHRSSRLLNGAASSHRSNPSTASRSSAGGLAAFSKPYSPVALLSPSISELGEGGAGAAAAGSRELVGFGDARPSGNPGRKSVDEMTTLLDQMIQDKVESGQVIRSEHGSLRVKRDTVMEKSAAASASAAAAAETRPEPKSQLRQAE